MGLIKITPERLEQSAKLVQDIKQTLDNMHKDLYNQTEYIASQWTGATSQNFYQMFNEAKPRIFEVNNLLDKISEELKHSAKKFREADQMNYMIAKVKSQKDVEYLKGSMDAKFGDGRVSLKGSGTVMNAKHELFDNANFSFKALNGSAEFNIPYTVEAAKEDVLQRNIIGVKIEGAVAEETIAYKYNSSKGFGEELTLTSKQGVASYVQGVEGFSFKSENMIALQVYEAEITKIKIPNYIPILGEYDIDVKGEIILGGYGYKIRAGEETGFSATAPNGYGGGFSFKFKKEE
ncbi:type VII secretion protein [Bacillus cereus]|uniref:Type VII secretion protein n=1 Tax=Bacillus cereus TaxID=1396 RepID=A0A2A8LJZ8_BACCE|nr:WXG100 family type VII secretion target [Bacillus cereus]PES93262.1 type VII secretion protein [Bacillus cereus]PFP67407.1 type VII secretion protein [Bacillus cereus]